MKEIPASASEHKAFPNQIFCMQNDFSIIGIILNNWNERMTHSTTPSLSLMRREPSLRGSRVLLFCPCETRLLLSIQASATPCRLDKTSGQPRANSSVTDCLPGILSLQLQRMDGWRCWHIMSHCRLKRHQHADLHSVNVFALAEHFLHLNRACAYCLLITQYS